MVDPKFHNTKVRLASEEEARLVQEALFKLGYGWNGGDVFQVQFLVSGFYFMYDNGAIKRSDKSEKDHFNTHSFREVSVDQILNHVTLTIPKDDEIDKMLSALDSLL